jgi:hypothetical protein
MIKDIEGLRAQQKALLDASVELEKFAATIWTKALDSNEDDMYKEYLRVLTLSDFLETMAWELIPEENPAKEESFEGILAQWGKD